jgi:hypothetical protein
MGEACLTALLLSSRAGPTPRLARAPPALGWEPRRWPLAPDAALRGVQLESAPRGYTRMTLNRPADRAQLLVIKNPRLVLI